MVESQVVIQRYALNCLGNVTYVDSELEPDAYIKNALAIRDVLNVSDRVHFEIWNLNCGLWYPIHGCDDPSPKLEIVGPTEDAFFRAKTKELTDLGKKALEIYQEWNSSIKQSARQRRTLKDEVKSSEYLEKLVRDAKRNVSFIDMIVAQLDNKDLRDLFRLNYQQKSSHDMVANHLHVSSSSIARYKRSLHFEIGLYLHKYLTNAEIEEKFHIPWEYEKWRHER